MFELTNLVIALCLFVGAVLYTSVGHAGSSAYIAIMTLFNLQTTVIKPTALTLNIAVSAYASWRYIRIKFFDKKLFFALSIGAIPAAFIGGHINLASEIYKPVVGVLLILSGLRFIFLAASKDRELKSVNYPLALVMGASIGFLSGILIFGVVSWLLSSEKRFGILFPLLIPVFLIYKLVKTPNNNKELEAVLKERNLL